MNCPVCSNPEAEKLSPTSNGEDFLCPSCGPFRISGSVQNLFYKLAPDRRRKALDTAKRSARAGKHPAITTHTLRKMI